MGKKRTTTSDKYQLSPPKPLNQRQAELIDQIKHREMVVTIGCAGTGKSFVSSCMAGYFYKKGWVKKIIITRPNIPTGKSLGAFPGYLEEKLAPWTRPIIDVLEDYLSKGAVETMIKNSSIELVPFETIRGRSWNDCFIILDEAQNCSKEEIKAFITRIGENSKTIINGDLTQSDIRDANGLEFLLKLIKQDDALRDAVGIVEFKSSDIVRSGLCELFVQALEEYY